jgi:hypothetical protein
MQQTNCIVSPNLAKTLPNAVTACIITRMLSAQYLQVNTGAESALRSDEIILFLKEDSVNVRRKMGLFV